MSSRIFIIALCGLFAPCLSFEVYDSCSLARFEHLTESSLMVAYSKCKLKLATKLSEAVSCLSPEAKENAELISKKVINEMREKRRGFYNNRTKDVPLYMAKTGLFNLIEQRIKSLDEYGLFVESSKRREHLKDKVESFIEASCRESYDSLKPMIDIFDLLGQSVTSTDQIDDTTREWLTRGRLCQTVLMETEKIRDPAFEYAYQKLLDRKKGLEKKMKEEFDRITSKLLAKYDPDVNPNEVLVDLERSVEIGTELENFGYPLKNSDKEHLHANRLLVELAYTSEDHCNLQTFELFRNLRVITNSETGGNSGMIREYLRFFEFKQYQVCSKIFRENLKRAVDGLTEEQIRDIGQLANATVAGDKYKGYVEIPIRNISIATLKFVESKFDAKINPQTPKKNLEDYIEQMKASFCNDVIAKLSDPILVYYTMMTSKDLIHKFDAPIHGWVYKDVICRYLESYKAQIIEMMHTLLKGQSGSCKKRKKLFGCF